MKHRTLLDADTVTTSAAHIKAWRLHRGMSVQRLERETGIDWAVLYRLERAERQMTMTHLTRIARALRVKPGRLLDTMPPGGSNGKDAGQHLSGAGNETGPVD